MTQQNKRDELLLKPEEDLREWIANFIYTMCEGRILPEFSTLSNEGKGSYYYKAKQIVAKAKPIIEKRERERIIEEINLQYDEDGELIDYPNQESWQALKGGSK